MKYSTSGDGTPELSAHILSCLGPELRVARCMQYGEYDDALRFHAIENCIWKARYQGSADFAMHSGKDLRKALDRIERHLGRSQELVSQPFGLSLVVPESGSKISPNLPVVDNPAGASATTGFGERLVSRNDVFRIALKFGQPLVNRRTVGVAQRYGSRIGGEAFPDQFGQAQSLFRWKPEDFGDVSVTHPYSVPLHKSVRERRLASWRARPTAAS